MQKEELMATLEQLALARHNIETELEKVIIGQKEVVRNFLIALFCNGHCLLEGVPGLAKTLLISSLAKALSLDFSRIQFTPDLMPSDITGTEILTENKNDGKRYFEFLRGPIFAHIVLADEINRTPPKTQSALLQAMQEYRVTAGNTTYELAQPFLVLATQNPIEQEGTYPLPEAQLDRFMFNITIDYPSKSEEIEIVKRTTGTGVSEIVPVLKAAEIIAMQRAIREIPASEHVVEYAVDLVRMTRPKNPDAPEFVQKWVSWGAGPRASLYLVLGAKALAALDGRLTPSIDDIKQIAPLVLRHRILVSFAAEAQGMTSVDVAKQIAEFIK